MDIPCNKSCQKLSSYICNSCKPCRYLCNDHAIEHLKDTKDKPQHELQQFISELSQSDRGSLLQTICNNLNCIQSWKNQISLHFKSISALLNQEYSKILQVFSNIDHNLHSILRTLSLQSTTRILKSEASYIENLIFNTSIEENLLPETLSSLEQFISPLYHRVLSSSIGLYENLYSSQNFSSKIKPLEDCASLYNLIEPLKFVLEENKVEDFEEIDAFYSNGYGLRFFDVNTLESNSMNLNTAVNFAEGAAACVLEEKVWFVSYENSAYLINTLKRLTTKLPNPVQKYKERGCTYKMGEIFLFGGVGGEYNSIKVVESEKYIRSQQVWNQIAHLPYVFETTIAELIDNRIYVVGYKSSSLLYYNEIANKYSKVAELVCDRCKVICDRWVLCNSEQKVWEIRGEFIEEKKLNNVWNGEVLVIGTTFKSRDFVYFVQWGSQVYRFNPRSLVIEELGIIDKKKS